MLIGQQHSHDSDEQFIRDMLPAFRDRRYIRINGRPLLTIYRPGLLPNPKATFAHWRAVCRREGLGEIYLAGFKAFDFQTPKRLEWTLVEFPPVIARCRGVSLGISGLQHFEGAINDYGKIVRTTESFDWQFHSVPRGNAGLG